MQMFQNGIFPIPETITADQIRDLRENGPRTIEYLNNCDMALAALRGEFGAGPHRAQKALEWCAEKFREFEEKRCQFDDGYEGVDEMSPPPGMSYDDWMELRRKNGEEVP